MLSGSALAAQRSTPGLVQELPPPAPVPACVLLLCEQAASAVTMSSAATERRARRSISICFLSCFRSCWAAVIGDFQRVKGAPRIGGALEFYWSADGQA